jgi:hypothetical protein
MRRALYASFGKAGIASGRPPPDKPILRPLCAFVGRKFRDHLVEAKVAVPSAERSLLERFEVRVQMAEASYNS